MSANSYDVIVLGAGMVGISTALHLQQRGKAVALVDRRPPAEETSYGNAGIIQSEAVMPYGFPRELGAILRAAFNRGTDSHLHYSALPELAPFLFRYWQNGTPERIMRTAVAAEPLVGRCLAAHKAWIDDADMGHLVRETGYLQIFRNPAALDRTAAIKEQTFQRFGITYQRLNVASLKSLEPHLTDDLAGGIHFDQPVSVSNPSALGKAYADLFGKAGGEFLIADARTLQKTQSGGWQIMSADSPVTAANAVVSLGPWSGELLKTLGTRVPLAVKRGYHMHYGAKGNAGLSRPVIDTDFGYAMTPMEQGIRLTTGAEFARLDAPKTPMQLDKIEPHARDLFPLGDRLEPEPWLGRRPCLPDMLPAIGRVPGHQGLWANFGHHHLGFTLGPITGRLLAQMMTGEPTFTDPNPYRLDRF